jgi:Mg-chelatase subunit ChlD
MLKALYFTWQDNARGIILITDGYPDEAEERILGEAMEHSHVPINPIGIGEEGRDFNEAFLRELARITGGEYHNVKEAELHLLAPTLEAILIGTDHGKKGGGTIQL